MKYLNWVSEGQGSINRLFRGQLAYKIRQCFVPLELVQICWDPNMKMRHASRISVYTKADLMNPRLSSSVLGLQPAGALQRQHSAQRAAMLLLCGERLHRAPSQTRVVLVQTGLRLCYAGRKAKKRFNQNKSCTKILYLDLLPQRPVAASHDLQPEFNLHRNIKQYRWEDIYLFIHQLNNIE